jgi:hypothetical protein
LFEKIQWPFVYESRLVDRNYVIGDKYKIIGSKLGQGIFGKVYKSENIQDENKL